MKSPVQEKLCAKGVLQIPTLILVFERLTFQIIYQYLIQHDTALKPLNY